MMTDQRKQVIIIGAGFAGLWAVKTLYGKKGIRVTMVDRNNYHTFFPLLYQVGAAEVEPEEIAYPIRSLLRGRNNVSFFRAEAKGIDFDSSTVTCGSHAMPYDYLIIATGSATDYYSVAGAERFAFPLKTMDDAMVLRNHILSCFERAAYIEEASERKKLLTFSVVGGGPTGVEFTGALSELIRGPLKKDFPGISMSDVSIVLVESGDRILPMFSPKLSSYAARKLAVMGASTLLAARVKNITEEGVVFTDGSRLDAATVVWTAGVSGTAPHAKTKMPATSNKRIIVLPTLQMADYPNVYVAGDLAFREERGAALPMIAPVAIQEGKHAAENIVRDASGGNPRPFSYRDRGAMVTIGRNTAVVRIGAREFRGFIAWILWIIIHIVNLIGFRNKLFVIVNWIWDYLFFERSVRLILPGCWNNPKMTGCFDRNARRSGEGA